MIEKIVISDSNNLFEEKSLQQIEPMFVGVQTNNTKKADENLRPVAKHKPMQKQDDILIIKKSVEIKRRQDFEALYEEVFAVQLPSQLWGIHRYMSADLKFMAFSRFDCETLRECDLVVRITDLWQYTVYFKGLKVKQDYLSILTEDSVTVLLDQIDNTKYYKNEAGEIQTKRRYSKRF